MSRVFIERILFNEPIAKDIYKLTISCGEEFLREFKPGQFAHLQIPNSADLLLRRPISVHTVNYEEKKVIFIYAVVGEGTKRLSQQKEGSEINVLMPLGNSFKIEGKSQNIWLVGGGIGCAPLLSVKDKYPEKDYKVFLGFRTKYQTYSLEEFENNAQLFLTTEDGSAGKRGFVTELLAEELKKSKPDLLLSCGPAPFFKSLKKVCAEYDVDAQASLEQRMGCGTGGCAVCVCRINGEYRKVCFEGPVFNLNEVDFDG